MKLIKNPRIPYWKQFNNGIIVDSGKSILLDNYPLSKPYITYGKGFNLCDILKAEGIELDKWKI